MTGNPRNTLLLVGAKDETLHKARALGLRVLLLQHPSKLTREQEELAHLIRVVDYTDWAVTEPVVRELHRDYGFTVALSLTEPGVENAGRVNDLYGLGGTGFEVARRLRNKLTMRQALAEHGGGQVTAAPLHERAGLEAFGARHGYPFVVKPTDGTASFGVFRVDRRGDIGEVWNEVRRLRGKRTDRGSTMFLINDYLMEEYVDGPEFSVESFSFAGRHVIVAITEKFVDPKSFTELGHVVPARLDQLAHDRVSDYTRRFLDAMGIRDGVCHTEIRIGRNGPVVIEGHNRPAGDAIPDLVRGAYGIDLTTYGLGWPFGLVPELPDRPRAHAGASTRFLVGPPGRIESVEGAGKALAMPGVLAVNITAKPGDPVRPLTDNWDRLGLVAVTGPDATTAIRRGAGLIAEAIEIKITGTDGGTHLARAAQLAEEKDMTAAGAPA
jgi:biotin carboxylase